VTLAAGGNASITPPGGKGMEKMKEHSHKLYSEQEERAKLWQIGLGSNPAPAMCWETLGKQIQFLNFFVFICEMGIIKPTSPDCRQSWQNVSIVFKYYRYGSFDSDSNN
jgi:hypothetical protein